MSDKSNDIFEIEDTLTFGEDLFMKKESGLVRISMESKLHAYFAEIADDIQFCKNENQTINEELKRRVDAALNQLIVAHATISSLYSYNPSKKSELKGVLKK